MKSLTACCAALLLGIVTYPLAQAMNEASLKALYDADAWFELRDAIQEKAVPPLSAGAVASAFNHVGDAEKHLRKAIREATGADAANEARGVLAMLYIRLGKSSDAGRIIDDILKAESRRADIENTRVVFGAFRDRPNQTIHGNRRSTFRCDVKDDGVRLPLSVNGKPVSWLLDTGANITVVSEEEAQTLKLVVRDAAQVGDLAGGTARARTTTAPRMVIARTELRNVPMLVVPDDRPPFSELEPGMRGIIGMPVALALQTIRWTTSGTCQTGFEVERGHGTPNLAFNSLHAIARVEYQDKPLDFFFDTGNQSGTQLWERFQRDFPVMLKEHGTKGSQRITQFGGSNEREVTVLPEVRLRVGGLAPILRPANVFSRPVGDDRHHGNLGMDILSQAREVTIDFRSMSLTLR